MTKAAIEAAAKALYQQFSDHPSYVPEDFEGEAVTALEAAMPHLRKQIAEEIRLGINEYSGQLIEQAARIAEGENK